MASRKAQRYDDSDSSDSSDSSPPPPKKRYVRTVPPPKAEAPPKEKKPRTRLPTGRRLEIIQNKERGIEDPEYSCSKSANGRYIVKKRAFPLDQSPHLDTTAGTMAIPDLQRVQTTLAPVKEPVKEIIPEKPAKDLQLSWINMQATVNDSLKRDLEALSAKYERLAEKEEKRKKEKKAKPPAPRSVPQPANVSLEIPPQQIPAQIPQKFQQPRAQPQLKVGQYARAKPLSLNQF